MFRLKGSSHIPDLAEMKEAIALQGRGNVRTLKIMESDRNDINLLRTYARTSYIVGAHSGVNLSSGDWKSRLQKLSPPPEL